MSSTACAAPDDVGVRSRWGFDRRDQCVLDPVVRQRLAGLDPPRWDPCRAWRAAVIAEALHLWQRHPPSNSGQ